MPLIVGLLVWGTNLPAPRKHVQIPANPKSANVQWDRRQAIVTARDEAVDRITHFNDLLVAIGSVQLGILAYIAGLVFKEGDEDPIRRKRLFFWLVIVLLGTTAAAYLHVWKLTVSHSIYVVQLEAELERGLRPLADTFHIASNPQVRTAEHFSLLKDLSLSAHYTLGLVAMYPVVLLLVAIFAFGRRLDVAPDLYGVLIIGFIALAFFFFFPHLKEFRALTEAVHLAP
jgi:hypothetical protein